LSFPHIHNFLPPIRRKKSVDISFSGRIFSGAGFPSIYRGFPYPALHRRFIYPQFPQYPQRAENQAFVFVFSILSISFINSLCYNLLSFENGKSGDDI